MMPTAHKPSGPAQPVLDRISFFDEQSRRRSQATAWALLTGLLAVAMGWSFGFLIAIAVGFYALLLSSLLPRPLERAFDSALAHAGMTGALVGGLVFAAALWLFVQRVFARDTSGGLTRRIAARPANPSDPEEKQLVNVAEEMAIAATAPVPRVLLFDGLSINAAAIGETPDQASLLISREMLNKLDRDETQGVIAHLLASVVNGDLRLTGAMLRAFYMMGLAVTLLDLPFSARARHALLLLIGYAFQTGASGEEDGGEKVGEALTASLQPEGLEPLTRFMQKFIGDEKGVRSVIGSLLLFPLLPLIMIRLGAGIISSFATLFVLGPLVALVLRSRRKLADATAVQLTRNPDGLASALVHLYGCAHVVSSAGWSEMAFIIGGEAAQARSMDRFQERVLEIKSSAGSLKDRLQQTAAATSSLTEPSAAQQSTAMRHNFVFGFHPSLGTRIMQLKRMGATKVEWTERKDYSGWIMAAVIIFVVGGVLLLIFASQRGSP